jgi:serine protease Do
LSESGGNEGIGFAAPSNIVRAVFEQIRSHGRVRRGVIGVNAQTITPALAAGLGLSQDWGVVVGDVYPGSPAASAGVQIGDIIRALEDKPMENARQFDVNVYRRIVGDVVTLDLLRGTERLRLTVAVSERTDDPDRFLEMVTPDRNLVARLGILGLDVDNRISSMLTGPRRTGGVLVAARAADTPASPNGLLPGDVILGINQQPILGLAGLRSGVEKLAPRSPCVLQVQRGARLMFIAIEIE